MAKDVYEKHILQNPHLPFLFNTQCIERGTVYSHWHENIEIISCIDGEGTVFSDSKSLSIKAGDTVIINSRHIHSITSRNKLVYHLLIIDKQFFEENAIDMQAVFFKEKFCDENASLLMEGIKKAFLVESELSIIERRNAVSAYFLYLCKNHICDNRRVEKIFTKSYNTVLLAMDYINENYSQKLTLEDIAKKSGYSKYHFARLFKETTGFTLIDHINATRCSVAKKMLIKTDKSVSEICFECGFDSCSYFSKTFKKFYGSLPSYYRKCYSKR